MFIPLTRGTFSALVDCGTPSVYPAGAGNTPTAGDERHQRRFIPLARGTLVHDV
ncbi:hypothetical protein JS561_08470 [Salmonella enterica subsp. enterica serovar Infantis]|nr:hypothetical protein JS561_08470 [Salmonella enterica subsp. enterica serovar Infantis]